MSSYLETQPDSFSFLIERVDEIIFNTTQKPVTRTAYEIEAEVLEDLNLKYSLQINFLNPDEKMQLRQHIDTRLTGNPSTPTEILQAIKAEVILELKNLTKDGLILDIEWDLSTQKKSTQYGPLFAIVKRLVNESSYDATYKILFTHIESHPEYV